MTCPCNLCTSQRRAAALTQLPPEEPRWLDAHAEPPQPSVFDVAGKFAAMCIRHRWCGPLRLERTDAASYRCPLCVAEWEETRVPERDGFARFLRLAYSVRGEGRTA